MANDQPVDGQHFSAAAPQGPAAGRWAPDYEDPTPRKRQKLLGRTLIAAGIAGSLVALHQLARGRIDEVHLRYLEARCGDHLHARDTPIYTTDPSRAATLL